MFFKWLSTSPVRHLWYEPGYRSGMEAKILANNQQPDIEAKQRKKQSWNS